MVVFTVSFPRSSVIIQPLLEVLLSDVKSDEVGWTLYIIIYLLYGDFYVNVQIMHKTILTQLSMAAAKTVNVINNTFAEYDG